MTDRDTGIRFRTGLDRCLEDAPPLLAGARFALLMNQASVDRHHGLACDALAARFPGQLVALFSPQHGLWGEEQANMVETAHGTYPPLGLPIHSLYSETRQPTREMLRGIDVLVVDLQDVGTRVYTFAWTLSYCLEACAAEGIPVLVLDRPNPLGGKLIEGPRLQRGYESFVGRAALPMRHGLSIGELARWMNSALGLGATLEVLPLDGWQRELLWPDLQRPWVPTSPNLPRFESVLLYAGQVLLEGTNLSEGRGTTAPFELVGAPFIDPFALTRVLEQFELPGVRPVPYRFRPTFDKWHNESCGGVALRITDARLVRPYATTVAILACVKRLWPGELRWLPPPYEYEPEKMPIDILSGTSRLRETLDAGAVVSAEDVDVLAAVDASIWAGETRDVRAYS